MNVFLCDLTHETVILVSDTIPVNIGYVASYAKSIHGDAIDVQLFKYPQSAIDAIKANPPDVLALSNYSWNSNLSERVAAVAKAANPDVVTVQGGTNFPHDDAQQLLFLQQRPATDTHVELEGEVAFANLVGRVLEARETGGEVFDRPIDGCAFIDPESRQSGEPRLIKGMRPARLKSLDDIPSPYLSGMLDHFFDGRLSPFIETNRGCPFKCTFCHTGNEYFQKVNMFSVERIRAELEYAAKLAKEQKNTVLHLADTNFGMFPRDREICEILLDLQTRYGWPNHVVSTTGKNNKERVIDVTSILGNTFSVTMSVQSMDANVLANINRSNIKLDHYMAINAHLQQEGRSTVGEMILGLPGETRESFTRGVKEVIDAGVSHATVYSLMMLYGTEFKDPAYRKKFEMEGKYRIVPLNFGEYDGVRVFDYEEVCVNNKDMPFEDYLHLRKLALLIETIHNNRPLEEFYRYAVSLGLSRSDFLIRVFDALDRAPDPIPEIFDAFMGETKGELWDSDAEMVEHYREEENYQRLKRGEVGGNLIYKYKSLGLVTAIPAWIDFLADILKKIVAEKFDESAAAEAYREIDAASEYCRNKTWKILEEDGEDEVVQMESDFDVKTWLMGPDTTPLSEYRTEAPVTYEFLFTDEQIKVRRDQFRRYGTSINGLSKMVTRVHVEGLFRSVRTADGSGHLAEEKVRRARTQYALSN